MYTKQKKKNQMFLLDCLVTTYEWIIVNPLRQLYYYGPNFGHFGFWSGMGQTEMCQILTPMTHSFWIQHPSECVQLLDTKFMAFRISVELVIYFTFLWKLWSFLNTLCWFMICSRTIKNKNLGYAMLE